MVDGLPILGQTRRAVRHQTLALGGPDDGTQVGLVRGTEDTVLGPLALGGVAGDDGISDCDTGDTLTNTLYNCGCFMSENYRKQTFWIMPVQCVNICVTQRIADNLQT